MPQCVVAQILADDGGGLGLYIGVLYFIAAEQTLQ